MLLLPSKPRLRPTRNQLDRWPDPMPRPSRFRAGAMGRLLLPKEGVFSLGSIGNHCCCNCNVTLCVPCSVAHEAGIAVTVTNLMGGIVATGTTNSSGCANLNIGTAGTYNVSFVDSTDNVTYTLSSLSLSCGQTVNSSTCCTVYVTPALCPNSVSSDGIDVTLINGSFSISGVTSGSSGVALSVPTSVAASSSTVSVAQPTFTTSTTSHTFGCGNNYNPPSLVPASGYTCINNSPCEKSGTTFEYAYPESLTLNDGIGDITLTFNNTCAGGTGSGNFWIGCVMRTFTSVYVYNGTVCAISTISAPVCFSYSVGGSLTISVHLYGGCAFSFAIDGRYTTCAASTFVVIQTVTMTLNSCYPYDATGSFSISGACTPNFGSAGYLYLLCTAYGAGTHNMTITS